MNPGVLLLAYGGPATPAEVRPFVEQVLAGRGSAAAGRVDAIARRYGEIGGVSPLPAVTAEQATALARELDRRGRPSPVFVGMRFGRPSVADALASARAQGVDRLAAVVMAPHRSGASRDAYREAVESARCAAGTDGPAVAWGTSWFDHPGFVDALVERVREAGKAVNAALDASAAWLISAHSLPASSAGAATYAGDLTATGRALGERFGGRTARPVYQSASPRGTEPWLGPAVGDAIREAAAGGARCVLVVPAGFVAENLETLWDLDRDAARLAAEAGVAFARAATVGAHPRFVAAVADSALGALEGAEA